MMVVIPRRTGTRIGMSRAWSKYESSHPYTLTNCLLKMAWRRAIVRCSVHASVCNNSLFSPRACSYHNPRPETVESLFIAYRLTGNRKYREYGWKIFQAIEKHAKVEDGGYVTVLDVNNVYSEKEDKMETFFLVRSAQIFLVPCLRLCSLRH